MYINESDMKRKIKEVHAADKPSGYQAIGEMIRRQIVNGQLAPDEKLPPIREEAKRYGVAYSTFSRVIRELQQGGYVRTNGRQGTVVSDAWQSRATASGGAAEPSRARPLRIGMLAYWQDDDSGAVLPLNLVLERLLTVSVFQASGTFHRFVWAPRSAAGRLSESARLVKEIADLHVDGLIMLSAAGQSAPDLQPQLRDAGIFCVGLSGTQGTVFDFDCITIDDRWAFREVTQRLIGLGHRRIAFVGCSLDAPGLASWDRVRLDGWRKTMNEAGLSCGDEDSFFSPAASGDPTMAAEPAGGWPRGFRLLTQETYGYLASLRFDPARHTAAVCVNDRTALGLMKGLRARGIRVPEDVSVTGFDNHPEERIRRELTTFALPEQKIVDAFLRIVASRVSGEKPEDARTTETLRPILVPRSSWSRTGSGK